MRLESEFIYRVKTRGPYPTQRARPEANGYIGL